MIIENKKALVVFGKKFPTQLGANFETIISLETHRAFVESKGSKFINIETLIDAGSMIDAANLLEELPQVRFPGGNRVCKSFTYEGYELWWIHYNSLFHHFCIPFFQYKRLLIFLKDFNTVEFYNIRNTALFCFYLRAYGVTVKTFKGRHGFSGLPFGVMIQIVLTVLSVPLLAIQRPGSLVFIGDKIEPTKDYDSRMEFVFQELRVRKMHFVEFVRSLESWKSLLTNFLIRRRPVIYSEAVAFVGRFLSIISGQHYDYQKKLDGVNLDSVIDPEQRFKILLTTAYLRTVYDDVWAIRIMKVVIRIIGIKSALFTAAVERNFHTVIGCKLNNVPTVGILHGVSSKQSTPYDFMNGYDGEKHLSLDIYGVWSEWWREHYIKNSDTYSAEQLVVSGPMRPLVIGSEIKKIEKTNEPVRVLLIAEQTATPREVMPYLYLLLSMKNISFAIKFRPFRDGFEDWLHKNEPNIFKDKNVTIFRGTMQEAIENTDVVVGCHSTGVLEASLQGKVPIFIQSKKWGDYYHMSDSPDRKHFFAQNPTDLSLKIGQSKDIPRSTISELCTQYFGDPKKNGSAWAVGMLEQNLYRKKEVC